MSTRILPSLLPVRDATEQTNLQDDLDLILLQVERQGDQGLLAISEGRQIWRPQEQKMLEHLEGHGYLTGQVVTRVSPSGKYPELTYRLSQLGRLKCAELRLNEQG